ncbi:hypothetical protein TNCT_88431 [Trichonephila clavata]|uniref:Uncharacterized protein n=1 Tax=Trichonephila clavata TaxID=2740835 RepID=A0A8X6KE92_TRICU|nr:hypothetical protein TNCT_88431 [Trichonephila clavata]
MVRCRSSSKGRASSSCVNWEHLLQKTLLTLHSLWCVIILFKKLPITSGLQDFETRHELLEDESRRPSTYRDEQVKQSIRSDQKYEYRRVCIKSADLSGSFK